MVKPQHIAIIMDGNGRWAEKRLLPHAVGHEQGGKAVERVVDCCLEQGIPWLTLYAFSSENWGRPQDEVEHLMDMLYRFLKGKLKMMMKRGVRIHAIGELERLPEKCRTLLRESMERTAQNSALTVTLALSYGSRQEITCAAKRVAEMVKRGEIDVADITPELVASQLYTAHMPDPDLLIRTSGEMRLSNYLLWQISYTELHVTPVLWPDFGKKEFEAALSDYATRHRRFGKR